MSEIEDAGEADTRKSSTASRNQIRIATSGRYLDIGAR